MSIKTYRNSNKIQISPHFNTAEFKCKCGKEHDILISDALVSKLETLRTALNCSKIILTSGYRCPTHDKNVGLNGFSAATSDKGDTLEQILQHIASIDNKLK